MTPKRLILICVVAAAVFVAGCEAQEQVSSFAARSCADHGGVRNIDAGGGGSRNVEIAAFTCNDGSVGEENGDRSGYLFYPAAPQPKGW